VTTTPPGRGPLDAGTAAALRACISPERLGPYERAAGDPDRALALYVWNLEASAAFFADLGVLEVALRNACHDQLRAWNAQQGRTRPWYDHPVLDDRRRGDVAEARRRVRQGRGTETEGRVIAELAFGFWRQLHAARYEAVLWTPALRRAYPRLQPRRRSAVYDRLDHLNTLRNRIAHHEPVHGHDVGRTGKDLGGLHADLVELLAWINPPVATWLVARSRLPALLAGRPGPAAGGPRRR